MSFVKILSDTNPNPFEGMEFKNQSEARGTIRDNINLCCANQVFVIVDFIYNESHFYKVESTT